MSYKCSGGSECRRSGRECSDFFFNFFFLMWAMSNDGKEGRNKCAVVGGVSTFTKTALNEWINHIKFSSFNQTVILSPFRRRNLVNRAEAKFEFNCAYLLHTSLKKIFFKNQCDKILRLPFLPFHQLNI